MVLCRHSRNPVYCTICFAARRMATAMKWVSKVEKLPPFKEGDCK